MTTTIDASYLSQAKGGMTKLVRLHGYNMETVII